MFCRKEQFAWGLSKAGAAKFLRKHLLVIPACFWRESSSFVLRCFDFRKAFAGSPTKTFGDDGKWQRKMTLWQSLRDFAIPTLKPPISIRPRINMRAFAGHEFSQ